MKKVTRKEDDHEDGNRGKREKRDREKDALCRMATFEERDCGGSTDCILEVPVSPLSPEPRG